MELKKTLAILFSMIFSLFLLSSCDDSSSEKEKGFVTVGNLDLKDLDNSSLIKIIIVEEDDFRALSNKICNDNITSPFELHVKSEDKVKEIPATSMYSCKMLRRVVFFDSSIQTIGEGAFKNTPKLVSFIPPESLEIIGANAFSDSENLAIFSFTENIKTIGNNAFAKTGIETINFPDNTKLQTIGDAAFINTKNLLKITIPSSVELIDKGAFENSSIQTLNFKNIENPDDINTKKLVIGDSAFINCKQLNSSLNFPDHLTKIGIEAFSNTLVTHIGFNDNSKLEFIGRRAFSGNNSIASITIPGLVKEIGEGIIAQNTAFNTNISVNFKPNLNHYDTWKLSATPPGVQVTDPNNYNPSGVGSSLATNLSLLRSENTKWNRNIPATATP